MSDRVLALYASDADEKRELLKLASPDNKHYFEAKILMAKHCIVSVLEVCVRARPFCFSLSLCCFSGVPLCEAADRCVSGHH